MACDLCANSRPGAQKRAVRGFIAGDCRTSSRNPACYKRYPESQTSASTNEPYERIDECATRAHRRMRHTSASTNAPDERIDECAQSCRWTNAQDQRLDET